MNVVTDIHPTKKRKRGEGRAKYGRIRAAVKPELKQAAEAIVATEGLIRSVSHLVESAMGFFLYHYTQSNGVLDRNGFPVIRS